MRNQPTMRIVRKPCSASLDSARLGGFQPR